jgi:hypothetical protein
MLNRRWLGAQGPESDPTVFFRRGLAKVVTGTIEDRTILPTRPFFGKAVPSCCPEANGRFVRILLKNSTAQKTAQ